MNAAAVRGRNRLMMRLPHLRENLRELDSDLAANLFQDYNTIISHMERLLVAEVEEDAAAIARYARLSLEIEMEVETLAGKTYR